MSEAHFEAPLLELRRRIEELEGYPDGSGHGRDIARLKSQLSKETKTVFDQLTRWQTTLVARHSERPYTLDYVSALMEEWVELHGDRARAFGRSAAAAFSPSRGLS